MASTTTTFRSIIAAGMKMLAVHVACHVQSQLPAVRSWSRIILKLS